MIWMASEPERLNACAVEFIEDTSNSLFFSTASIWDVAIKFGLGQADFQIEPGEFRQGFLDRGHLNHYRLAPVDLFGWFSRY